MAKRKKANRKRKVEAWWTPKKRGARRGTPELAEQLAAMARERTRAPRILAIWEKLVVHRERVEASPPAARPGPPMEPRTKAALIYGAYLEYRGLEVLLPDLLKLVRPDLDEKKARHWYAKQKNKHAGYVSPTDCADHAPTRAE